MYSTVNHLLWYISLGGSGLFGWLGGAFEVGDCYAGVGFEKAAEVALAEEVEAVGNLGSGEAGLAQQIFYCLDGCAVYKLLGRHSCTIGNNC